MTSLLFPLYYSRCSYRYILLSLLIESPQATQATRGVSGKRSLMHPARSLLVNGGRPYSYFSLCCVCYQPLHRRQGCLLGRWVSVDFPPFGFTASGSNSRLVLRCKSDKKGHRVTVLRTEMVHSVLITLLIVIWSQFYTYIYHEPANRCWRRAFWCPPVRRRPLVSPLVRHVPYGPPQRWSFGPRRSGWCLPDNSTARLYLAAAMVPSPQWIDSLVL